MNSLKDYTVHYVYQNGDALLSKNNQVLRYEYGEDSVRELFTLIYQQPMLNILQNPFLTRLLRTDVSHILALEDNSLLIFFDHRILKIQGTDIISDYQIISCRCPINVLYHREASLIVWGDYVVSKNKMPISIYISTDLGVSWKKKYTFKVGRIRHIHNIIYDNFRKHYWILTGDKNEESGIWMTHDFLTLTPYLVGSQQYRAVSIIPMKDRLIIPTDTEVETNHIKYYSHKEKVLENIQEINGSAMYASRINHHLFISTMYEPSKVNKSKYAELWHSINGDSWEKLLFFRKDNLPVKYFQYPIIKIPVYEPSFHSDYFYFSTRSVVGGIRTVIIKVNEL